MSTSAKSKKIWSLVATLIVIIAVGVILILIVNLVFQDKEEHISASETVTKVKTLECEAASPETAFFVSENATDPEHQLKVTYQGSVANTFYYTYEADFATPEAAETASAELHADYNTYMKSNASDLSPNFSNIQNQVLVSLFGPAKDLTAASAALFFISPEEYDQLTNYDIDKLTQIYQSKGFSCETED